MLSPLTHLPVTPYLMKLYETALAEKRVDQFNENIRPMAEAYHRFEKIVQDIQDKQKTPGC